MSDAAKPAVAYLYTTQKQFQEYLRHGSIPAQNECPFSINPDWEVAAQWMGQAEDGRRRLLSKEETRLWGGGLVRISVAADAVPVRYVPKMFWRMPRERQETHKAATTAGAKPEEWRFGPSDIPAANWLTVEIEEAGRWAPMPEWVAKG
jgi:hypothetical protein